MAIQWPSGLHMVWARRNSFLPADTSMVPAGVHRQFNDLLRNGLAQMGLSLAPEKIEQLASYACELRKWNRRMNLIARNTTVVDIVELHFIDSLTLLFFLSAPGKQDEVLLDVGTGAGFPGLVLAVARSDLHTVLVEPRLKRVSFLRHIVRLLKLGNVEIVQARIEESGMAADQRVDWVTCRALTRPGAFLDMVTPFMARGARALLMLGPEQERRLPSELPGCFSVETGRSFSLPWSGAARFIAVVKKQ